MTDLEEKKYYQTEKPPPSQYTWHIGIYETIARRFNNSVGTKIISVKYPSMIIRYPKNLSKNSKAIIHLLEKLAPAFPKIAEKYGLHLSKFLPEVKLDYRSSESSEKLTIHGVHRVPPSEIGKLMPLVLWYTILYLTGSRPKDTEHGKKMNASYKEEWKEFKDYINHLSRTQNPPKHGDVCSLCGKKAFAVNKWDYSQGGRKHEQKTPVCKKHRKNLI